MLDPSMQRSNRNLVCLFLLDFAFHFNEILLYNLRHKRNNKFYTRQFVCFAAENRAQGMFPP